jgi:hypothetical protein
MGQWAVVIPHERLAAERLYHHDTLELSGPAGPGARPAAGDEVLVIADGEPAPRIVALGRVARPGGGPDDGGPDDGGPDDGGPDDGGPDDGGPDDGGPLVVAYTRRSFDAPATAASLTLGGPVTALDDETFRALAARLAPAVDNRTWLVSLDLPIEAPDPAEAVRLFWSYVTELGPRELPAFVSPSGDELAMQAFVLGAEANQDPEEDD